jgi:hypothetical protein
MTGEPKCPDCGGDIDMGYGLAGGGIGAYEYCTVCHRVIDKWPDPELSAPAEMEADRKRRGGR